MPAPKKNPAVVVAIATALKVAKAAKAAKTVSSVAKKPVVKVQPKSNVKTSNPKSNVKVVESDSIKRARKNSDAIVGLPIKRSGLEARRAADAFNSKVGKTPKKPTVKIKTGSPWDKAGQKMSSSPKFK